ELACAVPLWPENRAPRAVARAISAEMHSGFPDLRTQLPMDAGASLPLPALSPETLADIRRIQAIWTDCRSRFGAGGPFLFGGWSIADAMFAPVATRFSTYGVGLDEVCRAYVEATLAMPAMQRWIAAAKQEE
ncbi:MAG TPA: glutathione S-transferase, partial [Rhodospirillaceae bacterium]|nr:glutathione S-transferase [Rhodospirillaceae bacterium]